MSQLQYASPEVTMDAPAWHLTPRQMCDLELLLNGAFHPLTGFMTQAQYQSTLETMHLPTGEVWPMPITLDVDEAFAEQIQNHSGIILCDGQNRPLAWMEIHACWHPDKKAEAQAVFNTDDEGHPGVDYLYHYAQNVYIGGAVYQIQPPLHFDFPELRFSPAMLRQRFQQLGWERIVGFQTRNPMHQAHRELTLRAAAEHQANLLIHPVVGLTKPGDIDPYTRVRCYQKMLTHYPKDQVMLSLLPLAMRMAGPREALWHAIIRKNYGCTHFIVGRDHAGPGKNRHGESFYGPYEAQALVAQHQDQIGIQMVPFKEMVYVAEKRKFQPYDEVHAQDTVLKLSGTEFRRRLYAGEAIPEWFSFPEVITELQRACPPRSEQGFTLFFTGLSGAGKSTLAHAIAVRLKAMGKTVTLLDGDEVRHHLSSELGFSRAHRDLNIRRIGFVAQAITQHRGIAICAPIAPFRQTRRQVRAMIEAYGGFIEIYVSTPLEVCEDRDPKGLYKKARLGKLKQFTGVDDPYEVPQDPEIQIDTTQMSITEGVEKILHCLNELGYLQTTTEPAVLVEAI